MYFIYIFINVIIYTFTYTSKYVHATNISEQHHLQCYMFLNKHYYETILFTYNMTVRNIIEMHVRIFKQKHRWTVDNMILLNYS